MSFFLETTDRWTNPDRAALVTWSDEVVSYGELGGRARQAAGWLSNQGVRRGDVVALQLPRSLGFLEIYLGGLAMGATILPLNVRYTDAEVRFFLDDSSARLHLGPDDLAHVRSGLDATPPAEPSSVDPDELAVLCYTSGTTGRPKGVQISHRNLGATVRALHDAWGWTPDDRLLHALPLTHIHGLFVAQHVALYAGATTFWLDRFQPDSVFDAIANHQTTVFMGVPTFYHRLLQHDRAVDCSSMRLFTSGSAPLPERDFRRFRQRFGHAILERYGMTEVGIVLSNPLDGERRPGSVGHPLPGVEARVVDGEIHIRGPSVTRGYLGRPEATEDALVDGWMRTGDLGFVDDEGYFHVTGRKTDLIITGGFNVSPREVEAALVEVDGIEQAAVVGAPDPDLGQRVVATLVGDPVEPELLGSRLRETLVGYKVPRAYAWTEALPRNTMGKVEKSQLRADWARPRIRRAREAEAPAIAERNVKMALETEDLMLDPQVARAGVQAVFERDVGAFYLVAEIAGQPVGQTMVTTEWSDWRNRPVWWIQSVYVEPDWRRQGVYRALHEAVVDRARAAGAGGVRLYVDHRNTVAQRVYERVGMSGEHYALFEQMFGG